MAGQGDLAVQYVKRLEGLEAVLQKSQDMQRIEEGCQKAQKAEWSYIKRDLGLQVEALRRRNQQLQAALADAKVRQTRSCHPRMIGGNN